MRYLRIAGGLLLPLALVVLVGCEWDSSGEDDTWNSAWDWVNFSGVYRAGDGGLLVTDYTATPGTPGVTNNVTSETVGSGNGVDTTYSGNFANSPVLPGTVTIVAGAFALVDDGAGVLADVGVSGTIDYGTGAWSIDLSGVPLASGEPIIASYQYSVSGSAGSGAAGPGSSGTSIYTFTVHHTGNVLEIVDNNGSVYSGKFGRVETSGGQTTGGQVALTIGDTVIGQFTASGTSAAGMEVDLVGTFQATVADSSTATSSTTGDTATGPTTVTVTLADRTMFGTWIESGGRTGDINGFASPVTTTTAQ